MGTHLRRAFRFDVTRVSHVEDGQSSALPLFHIQDRSAIARIAEQQRLTGLPRVRLCRECASSRVQDWALSARVLDDAGKQPRERDEQNLSIFPGDMILRMRPFAG
jgi:hypothetical protein